MISERVAARVVYDFPPNLHADVRDLLESATSDASRIHGTAEGHERIHSAMLILAHGSVDELLHAASEAELDWRDLLVAAGLENEDWPERVDAFLEPPA